MKENTLNKTNKYFDCHKIDECVINKSLKSNVADMQLWAL